jgi:hypothetical protein
LHKNSNRIKAKNNIYIPQIIETTKMVIDKNEVISCPRCGCNIKAVKVAMDIKE